MLVLVTYDVNTETAAGRRRLRKVAKVCVDYGQRVQNSVFECLLDAAQYTMFKAKLTELIDSESDSLRFYQLGNHYKSKVEHVGLHPDFDQCNLVRRTEKGRLRRRGWGLRWEKAQKGGKGTNLRGFFED